MKTKLTNKDKDQASRVLREAARRILVGQETCCCDAIDMAENSLGHAPDAFQILYSMCRGRKEKHGILGMYWWPHPDPESRIFALLLAAEWVQTESEI